MCFSALLKDALQVMIFFAVQALQRLPVCLPLCFFFSVSLGHCVSLAVSLLLSVSIYDVQSGEGEGERLQRGGEVGRERPGGMQERRRRQVKGDKGRS